MIKDKIKVITVKIKSTFNEIADWQSRQDTFNLTFFSIDMIKIKKFIRWMGWRK